MNAVEAHLRTFFNPATGLFHDRPIAECEPASSFTNGFMPRTAEKNCGAGIEDCAIHTGIALALYTQRGDTEMMRATLRGLVNLATVHGIPGFVARGICPEDGRSVCLHTSRDQYTMWAWGLCRFFTSNRNGDIDENDVCAARRVIADVVARSERNVTPENNYDLCSADGTPDTKGLLKMRFIAPHEAARLPMLYALGWLAGDFDGITEASREICAQRVSELSAQAIEESFGIRSQMPPTKEWPQAGYAFLKMAASLEVLAALRDALDADPHNRLSELLALVAEISAKRFLEINAVDGRWLSEGADLALAVAICERASASTLETLTGADLATRFRALKLDALNGTNGQPPLATAKPIRILSLLA